MSAELLAKQTTGLKEANTEQLQAIIGPFVTNIQEFKKAVNEAYVSENAGRKSLADQITRLMELNQNIGTEARNLTSALKGNSKVQGDWGEMILETMLENAGLTRGVHFEVQLTRDDDGSSLSDGAGHRLRPDVVVYMPDNRRIVIDSKVSLTAFVDLTAAEDEATRADAVKRHLASVKAHIDELGSKRYQDAIKGSAEQVMMFIPIEGAYLAAVQADPNLWQYAYAKKVAIVSPTHLFSSMQIVSQLWVQDKQNRNTIEIARLGGTLCDKVELFTESMDQLRTAIKNASNAYDEAEKRLLTGKGNAVSTAQKLQKLGATAKKTFPVRISEIAEEPQETPELPEK